jgi:hypothetical protein
MATLTIELPDEVLAQVQNKAVQDGKTAESLVQEWVTFQAASSEQKSNSVQPEMTDGEYQADRERVHKALKAAGLIVEIDPELAKLGDPTVSLEEVRQALSGGKPMSEIVIEQRGPLY